MAKADQSSQAGRQPPVFECKMGRIRGVVWKNEGKDGVWYSVSIQRMYRDGEGKAKAAMSFGKDDLLVVAEVARTCYITIAALTPYKGGEVEATQPEHPE